MCDKCDELDRKLEHYRSISITDEKTIEGGLSRVSCGDPRFALIRTSNVCITSNVYIRGFAKVRRIPLCETPLTLTPHIVARSFERLAKD
jgi:hypothetical protein